MDTPVLVPDLYLENVCCLLSGLTQTREPFKHKELPNSRDELSKEPVLNCVLRHFFHLQPVAKAHHLFPFL